MQVVFQNPRSSLNPRMRIGDILLEPLIAQSGERADSAARASRRAAEISRLLGLVGLDDSVARQHPHALSGGQAQRVAIARALALAPEVLVLDEPTSALDVSVQAQILNLLKRLQAELGLTYLFISHDLRVVRNISDRIAVMYLGKIVEIGDTEKIYEAPSHPYTQALLSAIPRADPTAARDRIILSGDVPNPAHIPSGCRFRTRCPLAAAICVEQEPELIETRNGQSAACHFAGTDIRDLAPGAPEVPLTRRHDRVQRRYHEGDGRARSRETSDTVTIGELIAGQPSQATALLLPDGDTRIRYGESSSRVCSSLHASLRAAVSSAVTVWHWRCPMALTSCRYF